MLERLIFIIALSMGTNQPDSQETIIIPKKYAVMAVMLLLGLLGYIVFR